jgi:hypothetical protein
MLQCLLSTCDTCFCYWCLELCYSFKLARQLQLEEDRHAWKQQQRQLEAQRNGAQGPGHVQGHGRDPRMQGQSERHAGKEKKKDKGDCIIM